jgi:hypothetical protein
MSARPSARAAGDGQASAHGRGSWKGRHAATAVRWLLPLAVALAVGGSHAQSATCASLEAPFTQDAHDFARGVIAAMYAENQPGLVRDFVHLQGWPTATWGKWEFQYPPTWALRDIGMLHAWVSDARDASHLLFVIQTTTPGNPTIDELLYGLLTTTIGPYTPCDRVSFVASDATRRWYLPAGQDDVGMVYTWVFRWIDARFGAMIASLKLDVQARGVYTAYGYVFNSASEAELADVVLNAFAPMVATYRSSIGGSDRDDKPKKKGDGDGEDGEEEDED